MTWPNNADGDVMRSLQAGGFNFDREVEIDFNIDFDEWPPDSSVTGMLQNKLPSAVISVEEGCLLVQVRARLTYQFVINMQAELTALSDPFGGICESWGVWSDPRD
jgi:hypothetical protein